MIETLIAVVSAKEFKIAVSLIKLLRNALKEDVSEVLKKKIADSELHTAQSVLDSLGLEAPENWINGINRAISHIESAFTLYNDKGEFESSCVCAMYLSVMHKAIGNNNDEFHKSIWLKVPVKSKDAIRFGRFEAQVKSLLSESAYRALTEERTEKRIHVIDETLDKIRLSKYTKYMPNMPETYILKAGISMLGNGLSDSAINEYVYALEEEKRRLQGIRDDRSDFRKALDFMFWF